MEISITEVKYEGLEYPSVKGPFIRNIRPSREMWSLKIDDVPYVYFIYFVYHETILTTLNNYYVYGKGDVLHNIELPLNINNPAKTITTFYKMLMLQ